MRNETSIDIKATPERVWSVLVDVDRWPEWTPTMASVKRLDKGEFRLGSRARIRQPKLMGAVWRVNAMQKGRSFEWSNASAGLRSVAGHLIESNGAGARVTLWVEHAGLMAPVIRMVFGDMTREYLQQEADGLKKRCEDSA